MRKQDQLIHLIHSLTAAEKKFFKEYTAKNKTGQSYMKLYAELQKAENYNAGELCKRLGKTKANLGHEKEYLQEILLKVLRECHSDNPQLRIGNAINTIIVLVMKGEYHLSHDLILKTIKEARLSADFYSLQKLYDALMHVTWYTEENNDEKFKERRGYIAAMRQAIESASDLLTSEEIKLRIAELWKKSIHSFSPQDMEDIRAILDGDFIKKKNMPPTLAMEQEGICATLYYFLGEKKLACEHKMRELEITERSSRETHLSEQSYVILVKNALSFMFAAEMFDEAEALLQKISRKYYNSLPLNQEFLDRAFAVYYFESMLMLYQRLYLRDRKSKNDLETLLRKFEKSWKDNDWSSLLPVTQISLFSTVARVAFLIEDYDTSLFWFEKIINLPEAGGSGDIHINSRMARAMIQYQFGNYSVAKSLAASTANFIKKVRPVSKTEKAVLLLLSNIWKKVNKAERQGMFGKLKKELDALSKIDEEKRLVNVFYYQEWVDRNLA